MSHDWQTQKAETFQTFKQGARGVKLPKEAVVVFYFLAEGIKPQWAAAEKALALFKDIEASGGFLHQLKEGTIQRKIQESAAKEQELFDLGEVGKGFHGRRNWAFRGEITPHRIERYFHESFLAGPRGGRIRPQGSR